MPHRVQGGAGQSGNVDLHFALIIFVHSRFYPCRSPKYVFTLLRELTFRVFFETFALEFLASFQCEYYNFIVKITSLYVMYFTAM